MLKLIWKAGNTAVSLHSFFLCWIPSPPQSLDSDLSDGPITMQEYVDLKNALTASEVKIQHLMKANNNLSDELRLMQKKVSTMLHQ